MIKTILVPVDGSVHASTALDFASILARDHDAALVLLHIGFRGGNVPEDLEARAERAFEEAERAGTAPAGHPQWSRHHRVLEFMGRMILEEAQAKAAERGVTQVRTELDWGDPGERILHWAKHAKIDLIVIGSRGYSELEGLMLGSVSHKVLNLAPCPCATIREAGRRLALDRVARLLVATDGSDHGARAVAFASEVAARAGAPLTIMHMVLHGLRADLIRTAAGDMKLSETARADLERDPIADRFALYVTRRASKETLVEVGQGILERAERAAREAGVSEVRTELKDGDPAEQILDLAKRDDVDLVVIGSRGLGEVAGLLRGSVSNKVTHLALCTVLSVR
jgi:nucleotide-binding universal stress UspA family protein